MRLFSSGILSDHMGRIFLQQESPTRLTPVGRPLPAGSTPAAALDSAFREETGLIVMPVRMTAVYFDPTVPEGELTLCYRCTMRGGDLVVPEGGRPAGFFDYTPLPAGLSPKDRQMVDDAVHHAGGPPQLVTIGRGIGRRLGRLLGRGDAPLEGQSWRVAVRVAEESADGPVECVIADTDVTRGATPAVPHEPPWMTAGRLTGRTSANVQLARVEIDAVEPALTLVFAPAGRSQG